MNTFKLIVVILSIVTLSACTKTTEVNSFSEPITILTPATNPANTISKSPISYKVTFTNDEYIDSVMMSIQIDSAGVGYKTGLDSLFKKVVYPIGSKHNIETVEGTYTPPVFPPIGKNIYLLIEMVSANRYYYKILKLQTV